MSVFAASGTAIHVSAAAPATYDQAGYEALTWTKVSQVGNIGTFGPRFETVEYDSLNDGKFFAKGQRDDGQNTLTFAHDASDAGQGIIETAAPATGASGSVSVRLISPAGETYYYRGPVMGFQRQFGASNDVVVVEAPIQVDSPTVVVV